jgi:hypothetical protein
MRTKGYLSLLALLALCVTAPFALAQGSKIKVVANFAHPVNVGQGQVLQPGQYTFDMLSDQTDRDTFRVRGQDGKDITLSSVSFDSRKMGVPTAGALPDHTAVVLENVDGTYYLHEIMMQGENRGFQFPLPDEVKGKVNDSTRVVVDASGGQPL